MDIGVNLQPIDEIIENKFIPALFGRDISTQERELLSLPVKEGGLGIRRVHAKSSQAYTTSRRIMTPLYNNNNNNVNLVHVLEE